MNSIAVIKRWIGCWTMSMRPKSKPKWLIPKIRMRPRPWKWSWPKKHRRRTMPCMKKECKKKNWGRKGNGWKKRNVWIESKENKHWKWNVNNNKSIRLWSSHDWWKKDMPPKLPRNKRSKVWMHCWWTKQCWEKCLTITMSMTWVLLQGKSCCGGLMKAQHIAIRFCICPNCPSTKTMVPATMQTKRTRKQAKQTKHRGGQLKVKNNAVKKTNRKEAQSMQWKHWELGFFGHLLGEWGGEETPPSRTKNWKNWATIYRFVLLWPGCVKSWLWPTTIDNNWSKRPPNITSVVNSWKTRKDKEKRMREKETWRPF